MPYITEATMDDVQSYSKFNKLNKPVEEVEAEVANGAKLTQRQSSFSDPGDDWNELLLDGKRIGWWPGY